MQIEEDDEQDLAVVSIPADLPAGRYSQFGSEAEGPLHRMAGCSRTSKARVLFQQGQQ